MYEHIEAYYAYMLHVTPPFYNGLLQYYKTKRIRYRVLSNECDRVRGTDDHDGIIYPLGDE
jgi:hypothetical protein